ncbi:MAG TPA: SAM-dependent methyltransferase [Verrucomicrobiae bacterium]|nr:SAM-dependent methyltransferase [Verrucomicrobiae bacterium]
MLAPSVIPDHFAKWNLTHGAPHGRSFRLFRLFSHFMTSSQIRRVKGPFSVQSNNTTRAFEYPWAFEMGKLQPGMRVLEVGGGLSGFQFVLDQSGCSVVNVDPGMESKGRGWPCDKNSIMTLNRCFKTHVDLRNTTIDKAGLVGGEFARTYSISVIEHLALDEAATVMSHVFKGLEPGGLFILTIDLFLNLHPFSSRRRNEYGLNQNVYELISNQPWELVVGDPGELFGFSEFNKDGILSRLETFLVGRYPTLVQCLVLKKPD